jgi:GntR family transcriptional regulator
VTNHEALPVPLYQRVFGILNQSIQNGTYEAGQQLPTETELAAEFKVSKGTIRQALAVLADRGLIQRKQGSGTFVAETHHPTRFIGSFTDIVLGSKNLRQRDFRLEAGVPFPTSVRLALGSSETHGTVIVRRREVNGEIFAYSIQHLSPLVAPLVSKRELAKSGFISLLHNHGFTVLGADQSVTAELASADVAENLEIELGAPVLAARRVLRSDRGPVEVVHGWYRGDRYEWQTQLTVERNGDKLILVPVRHHADEALT